MTLNSPSNYCRESFWRASLRKTEGKTKMKLPGYSGRALLNGNRRMWRDFAIRVSSRVEEYPSFKTRSRCVFFMRIAGMWMEGEKNFFGRGVLGRRTSPV